MSHQDVELRNVLRPLPDHGPSGGCLTTVSSVVLIALVLIGTQLFDLWPETTKRFLWESLVRLTPIRFIQLMERHLKLRNQGSASDPPEYTDIHAKSAALERIFRLDGIPALVKLSQGRAFSIPLLPKSTKPPGLGNWDNSCYQNSMLQGLSSLTSFQLYLSSHLKEEVEGSPMPTHTALEIIISKLRSQDSNGKTLWTPRMLKSMSSWQQQDAQEYFSKVIGEVDNETLRWQRRRRISSGLSEPAQNLLASKEANPPMNAFLNTATPNPLEGLLAQRVGCLSCGYCEGLTMIPFNCLTLSLGTARFEYDIQDCLDDYTALEQIDGVDCAKCTLLQFKTQVERLRLDAVDGKHGDPTLFKTLADARLGMIEKALAEEDFSENMLSKQCHISPKHRVSSTKSKQTVIARAPQSLVIHVNRSMFDEMTGAQLKNGRPVRFQLGFDLSEWTLGIKGNDTEPEKWTTDPTRSMLAPPGAENAEPSRRYELRAAVTHYGRHENGHYIAYKKLQRDNTKGETPSELNKAEAMNSASETWYKFSDADVTEISEEALLCHNGVFMLFYEAVSVDLMVDHGTLGVEGLAPTKVPGSESQPEIKSAERDRNDQKSMLPTPSPTPEPIVPAVDKPRLGIDTSVSDKMTGHPEDLPPSPSPDEPYSKTSGSEVSNSLPELPDHRNSQPFQAAQGVAMRTASDVTFSYSHGQRSSDSITIPSRSIISAS